MNIIQFADSHETSIEIAKAILSYVEKNCPFDEVEENVEGIWNDPMPEIQREIIAEAWLLADSDEDTLYWGEERITR